MEGAFTLKVAEGFWPQGKWHDTSTWDIAGVLPTDTLAQLIQKIVAVVGNDKRVPDDPANFLLGSPADLTRAFSRPGGLAPRKPQLDATVSENGITSASTLRWWSQTFD